MVAIGEKAPEFEAPDHTGATFRSSALRGSSVVMYFYPKADTPGCTTESKGFRDVYAEYQAKNVKVIGVSTDDCDAQRAFRTKYGFPFPLIADSAKKVATLYGVLGPHGNARRVTFLIDPSGKVVDVIDSSSVDLHLTRARAAFLAK
ncbi:MAG: peroxiredoxin [Thermoplasmata archaeon]|nr:peroxiredoxin [Thermoplasmata archaeon]